MCVSYFCVNVTKSPTDTTDGGKIQVGPWLPREGEAHYQGGGNPWQQESEVESPSHYSRHRETDTRGWKQGPV